jgi:RNA polymerase sigma-70 factor (ECF subfamily)
MTTPTPALTPAEFEELLPDIRQELHRYAARMTGSVIDGEDVVQEALVKAYSSLSLLTHTTNVRGWLFRITHNKAIDHLRRDNGQIQELLDEYPISEEVDSPLEDKELTALALSMFLKLVPRQRSCVILKDVLGYSLAEISELLNATVPEIKATLHRGRARLRELAASASTGPTPLDADEQKLLALYVERFNAYDFESIRVMLADEVHLDLVNRVKLDGAAELSNQYFYKYAAKEDWRLAVGTVEGHPAILVYDRQPPSAQPIYFILLTWQKDRITRIRDYRFAPYVIRDAEITVG